MVKSAPAGSGRKLFFGLFIFPLLIAVVMAVLLCTVVLLTREVETPESLITAIKTGAPSKRWQKAFELSNELNQGRGLIREAGVMNEVIHILNNRSEYDAKTRSYMALALSHFDQPEAVTALEGALRDETDVNVQLHLIWALGVRASEASPEALFPALQSDHEELRQVAAYAAGSFSDNRLIPHLNNLLDDKANDVRWNAALSLARLGNDGGRGELLKMLDRETLKTLGVPESKHEDIIINAVKGLTLLKQEDTAPLLKELSQQDPSLKVRQAVMDALKLFESQD